MKQILMSQLAVQIRGVSYKPDDLHQGLDENSIALLRANNIDDGEINFNDLVYVDRSKVSNNQLLRQGDILICASSGSKNLVGKAAQVDFNREIAFGAFCKVVRPTTVESDYLGMYFQSPIYRKIVSSLAQGANINNIKNADIDNLLVNIPNNDTKKKIVEIFKRMQSIIRNRQQQLQKLDELVKARFVELFGEPKINPHNYPACQLSEHISFLTSGSRGWAQYCTDNGSEWFITIKNVKDCHVSTDNMQPIDAPDNAEAKRTKVQEGDLLISITADLGRTGVVTKEIAEHGAYINQHLTCIRLNKTVLNPLYVAYFMESPAGKEQFELKNQSAVKAGLNFNSIKSLRIMIPPISEQNVFVAFLNQVDKSKLSPYRDCWTRCNFCLAVWCDNTSNKEDIMEWLMNLDPSIWAALIGAVGAIIVALIKVIIPLFKKKEKASDKVAPSINQTVTGNGNTVIGIQNNMKGEKDGQ